MRTKWLLGAAAILGLSASAGLSVGGCSSDGPGTHEHRDTGSPSDIHAGHHSSIAGPQTQPGGATASAKAANAQCPMTRGAEEPGKADGSLAPENMGRTVALGCGGCPAQWDKPCEAAEPAKLVEAGN